MTASIVLASGSQIRADLLRRAGLTVEAVPARVDEDTVKAALVAEGATPRDVADALAEMKARKFAEKRPDALVLGCDQVLDVGGRLLSKPVDPADARAQLSKLAGQVHRLHSAAVIYDDGRAVWRHVGVARLHVRPLSETFIADYVDRTWDSIRSSVGCYKIEEDGAILFTRIEGDVFTIQGLPLLELLSYLVLRGTLQT